jgi:hypothetical protein
MKIFAFASLLFLLASCASTSGVFPVGNGMYRVSTRATWELGGRAGATRMALKEATDYCAAHGGTLRVIKSSGDYGHFEGGTVDLTFTCDKR